MAGVLMYFFPPLFFLMTGVIEIFFFQYYTKYKFSSVKSFKNNNTTKLMNIITANAQVAFITCWHFLSYFNYKLYYATFDNIFNFLNIITIFFFIFSVFFYFVTQSFFSKNYSYQSIVFTLFFFLYLITFCKDYISFLIIIETITTLYFFFFIKYSFTDSLSTVKYKNLISYYLWLSFFTLIFIILNLMQWVYFFGSLDFLELTYFINNNYFIIIFVSFFWKLGVPGFHFFKIEVYKYLDILPLIIFSTISLLINTLLIIYLLNILNVILTYKSLLILIVIISNIILLLQGVDKIYFFYFLALSSINTWTFFIIISLS